MSKALPHSQTRKRVWIPCQFAVLATSKPSVIRRGTLRLLQYYCIPTSLITVFVRSQNEFNMYKDKLPQSSYGSLCLSNEDGLLSTVYSHYKEGTPLVVCRDSLQSIIEYDACAPQKERPVQHFLRLLETLFQTCQKEGCTLWGLYPVSKGLYFQQTISKTLKWISGGLWGCFCPGCLGSMECSIVPEMEIVLKTWTLFQSMLRWNFISVVWDEPVSTSQRSVELHRLAQLYGPLVNLRETKGSINLELLPI